MIIVRFSGGLGNQIYQYALLRKIQLRYPDVRIKMDLSFYKRMHIHNGYELEKLFAPHILERGYDYYCDNAEELNSISFYAGGRKTYQYFVSLLRRMKK